MKIKILIFVIFTAIAITFVVGLFNFFGNKPANLPKYISVSGVIADIESNKPLSGLTVKTNEEKTTTDQNGTFKFDKILSNADLLITGGSLYEDVEIPVAGRTEIKIFLSGKLLSTFRDIENYEQNRQYRKLYDFFSEDIKKQYSLDEYLRLKNQWRDDIVFKKSYNVFKIVIDRSSIKQTSNGQISVKALYEWSKDGLQFDQYQKQIPLIFVNDRWVIDDNLIWKIL